MLAAPATSAAAPADLSVRDYNRAVRRVALVILAIGVLARLVRFVVTPPIWSDEAMLALNFTGRGFFELTRTLDYEQVCPVLFLWAERTVFLLFGDHEWVLRLLPFLSGLAALAAFWDFARRSVSPTAAALAVGLLAVGRWPVNLSSTLKPYSGDLFWASVLLALAALWHQRPERLGPLVVLLLAVPVAVAASYPVVFVAGAIALYLLPTAWRHRNWRAKVAFAGFNLLLVGAFAACLVFVGREQPDPSRDSVKQFMLDYWRDGFPPDDPVRFPLWLLAQQTGRMSAYPIGDANGGSSLTALLFASGVWLTWRGGNRPLVVVCLVPFALNLVAALLHRYPYGGCCRLSQHLAPAVCLMAGVGWARLHERIAATRSARLGWVWASFALLATYAAGQVLVDAATPEHDPWCRCAKRLDRELRFQLRPGDRFGLDPASPVNRSACQENQEFHWYATRLRRQRVDGDAIPRPSDVSGRFWALAIGHEEPDGRLGREYTDRARAAGWVPVADVTYCRRPDWADHQWHNCRVVCFRRPDDPPEAVYLNTAP
jgi:hypothetical protein